MRTKNQRKEGGRKKEQKFEGVLYNPLKRHIPREKNASNNLSSILFSSIDVNAQLLINQHIE